LAFSGGGIRSATFNLGILQGFANLNLLPMFDYLSTVSGGGYIGSWVATWIYRAGKDPEAAQCANDSVAFAPILRVQECLKTDRSNKVEYAQPKAIRFLREYSNYLTPRLGFLGADTWAAVAIYFRNLLLNQTLLLLFLFFVLLLPHTVVWMALAAEAVGGWLHIGLPLAAFVLVLVAQYVVSTNMTHLTGIGPTGEFPPIARQSSVLARIVAPLFVSAWCLSVWISSEQGWNWPVWVWVIFGIVGFALTWTVAALWGLRRWESREQSNSLSVRLASVAFSILSGSAGGLVLWFFAHGILKNWSSSSGNVWHVVSFGTPLMVLIFLIVGILQLGLMGRLFPDPRREWWGRLGGWLLILSLVWTVAFGLTIYSPLALMWALMLGKKWVSAASMFWLLITAIGVLGGKNANTGSPSSPTWKDTALSVTPYVFIIGLGAGLATLLELALSILIGPPCLDAILPRFLAGSPATQGTSNQTSIVVSSTADYIKAHWTILTGVTNFKLVVPLSIVAGACVLLAWRLDLNQFSMNLFYRNRLVRCYLGASHRTRKPNPFSGFDPADDVLLSELRSSNCYSGPFPIVNTSLNLVKGQNLAWQERKAESFVMTPFRCGFDTWPERLDLDDESARMRDQKIHKYGFRPTEHYEYRDGGPRVGTAVSISGAAASPNMGYHSSPSLAFLMTFFNVRLGFWGGNPRHDITWTLPGPRFGLFHLLTELFGQSDDEAKYVYLSDGGHFENLGLYELIKRRCKYIVVCDADCDREYGFGDLGNAIRKCREDIGVEIQLDTHELTPSHQPISSGSFTAVPDDDENERFSTWHWAVGKIHYSLVDPKAQDGVLVYLKTSLTGDEPADVLNYQREHPDFPHQTTGDQWFSESEFESYRKLGQHTVERLFEKIEIERQSPGDIFRDLAKVWTPRSDKR
jgi:Patatin-like phospholipase